MGRARTILKNLRSYALPSEYSLRMEGLRCKIFGETVENRDFKSQKIVRVLQKMPDEDNKYRVDYYPPHPMFHYLVKMLRLHGLYRDEHLDFREEMSRVEKIRGKVRPLPGEGKRSKMKKASK